MEAVPFDKLLGPYGLVVGCIFAIWWLLREQKARDAAHATEVASLKAERDKAFDDLLDTYRRLAEKAGGADD